MIHPGSGIDAALVTQLRDDCCEIVDNVCCGIALFPCSPTIFPVKRSSRVLVKVLVMVGLGWLLFDGVAAKLSANLAAKPAVQLKTVQHSLPIGGQTRTYRVHVPSKYQPGTKVAAVLVLHGLGGNAEKALAQGKWLEKSDQAGFIAVGLDGTLKDPANRSNLLTNPRRWNAGELGGAARGSQADDIGFVNAVIDQLVQTGRVDPQRIYVTGFSNGAAMAFRVGVELSHRVAAIAPVANAMLINPTALKQPVSLLLIWGTADPVNPFNGGTVKRSGQQRVRPSADSAWKTWGKLLNCPPTPQIIYQQRGVTGTALRPCKAGSEALFYSVEGMGHTWPGGSRYLPEQVVGRSSTAIDATDLIWTFFVQHPKR